MCEIHDFRRHSNIGAIENGSVCSRGLTGRLSGLRLCKVILVIVKVQIPADQYTKYDV